MVRTPFLWDVEIAKDRTRGLTNPAVGHDADSGYVNENQSHIVSLSMLL
jgi:hypothetical protein